jgi:hypothetical protein
MRSLVLLLVLSAAPAAAERKLLVALTVPEGLAIANHDVTIPMPGIRVGYRFDGWSVDAGVGYMPMPYDAEQSMVHVGTRRFLRAKPLAPYVMARVGLWNSRPDEGDAESAVFGVGGAGVEYAGSSGFTAWIELGAGGARYEGTLEACFYVSAGIGYRFED